MNRIITLTKKELDGYFNSPLGYVVASVFLLSTGWVFTQGFFINGQASLRAFFALMPLVLIFILPAVTMSSWAQEKQSGTAEVLLTLPVENLEAVLGKFFSALAFLLVMLLFTFPLPLMVMELGTPDRGILLAGYLGTVLLGAAYIAVGLWVSSVTKNQIIAFLVALVIIFAFYIVGSSFFLDSLPAGAAAVGKELGFASHFDAILRGVLALKDLVYYLSVVVFFLYLNVVSVGERGWK